LTIVFNGTNNTDISIINEMVYPLLLGLLSIDLDSFIVPIFSVEQNDYVDIAGNELWLMQPFEYGLMSFIVNAINQSQQTITSKLFHLTISDDHNTTIDVAFKEDNLL
ncbi:unnamed protein product, partial [Didymodactylos carnosus]